MSELMLRLIRALLLFSALALAPVGRAEMAPAPNPEPAPNPASPATATAQALVAESLDYTTLSQLIFITSLRAGTHTESGKNHYYFAAVMYGLLNSPEERNSEFSKRKKLAVELGNFGDTKIDALAVWLPDEKAKNIKEFHIDGNAIRELAARTMTEFKVPEGAVAVQVEIAMFLHNKKFIFFGEDKLLAKTLYYPISQTKFDTPLRTNQTLTITDDFGTDVKLAIRYDHPATATKVKAAAAAPKP